MGLALELWTRPPGFARVARYAPEFLEAMRGRKFRNPDTGNENVFESLPEAEQKRIHDHWMNARQRRQQDAKPHSTVPQEALAATRMVRNQDPNRYRGVEVEYGSLGEDPEQIKKELHGILGESAKAAGMTPEQLALDLAGGGGLAGQLTGVKILTLRQDGRDAIMVSGEGEHIMDMDRELHFRNGQLSHVHNKHLELSENAPAGTGTRMLATQVASIKDAGGKYIETTGAGSYDTDYAGYYVWPLLGFDGELPENDVEQLPDWLREELDDTGGGPPYYISELMSFSDGRKYWLEHGSELELKFQVDDDEVLQKYLYRKADKAGKTVGQFLHNASKKDRGKNKVEGAPRLDKDDLQILSAIWDSQPKKRKKKDKTMTTKEATRALIDLAKTSPELRDALLGEVAKEANINWNIRDFTIDEFSQHQMLKNLREGDLVEILFSPDDLHPQRIATRLVDSDFDPMIPGVTLRGAGSGQEMLVDRGQDMPLMWEPGEGYPAYPVIQLKIVHSKLAAEAEEKSDKATANQVQFALDLAEEKGKSYTEAELKKKTKSEISTLIETMQGEENVASDKQVAYALSLLNEAGKKTPSKSSLEKMPEADVSKLIDRLKSEQGKKASDFSGGEEILEALGGYDKLASMIGARDILVAEDALTFKWPNRTASKGTRCMIMKAGDQYQLGFGVKNASDGWDIVGRYTVAKDELVPTFEKHTGWFLRA